MKGAYPLGVIFTTAVALSSCTQDAGREFARYYDEQGMFAVSLPAAHDITVTAPQLGQGGPDLITGVVSSPPAPSPEPATGLGGLGVSPDTQQDRTIYQAFVVASDGFDDVDEMALYFLTGDPAVDVVLDDPTRLDGRQARLIVADVRNGDQVTASVAAAMTLGDGETGYLVAAVFPAGDWEAEQTDFERIVASFRSDLPPGVATFPVAQQAP